MRDKQSIDADSLTATQAKNEFGRLLEKVIRGGRVVITRHDSPKAILISIEEFNSLASAHSAKLDTLAAEFDAELDRMQLGRARAGMKAAFGASSRKLGKAAVSAARKRG